MIFKFSLQSRLLPFILSHEVNNTLQFPLEVATKMTYRNGTVELLKNTRVENYTPPVA